MIDKKKSKVSIDVMESILLSPWLITGSWSIEKKKKKNKSKKWTSATALAAQSEPPRTPVSQFFRNGTYPIGEIQEYEGEWV